MRTEPRETGTFYRARDLPLDGVTPRIVQGRGWTSPTTGVHARAGELTTLTHTCRAVQAALPAEAVFTHLTAAALRGWWLPVGISDVPIVASTMDDAPHHDRRGCYVRRCRVPDGHRTVLDGVRIASAAWTIAELAEHLGLIDLTAVIDCALHRGDVSLLELWAVCVKGRRGVRTLRRAIRLSDARSESFWETILRLLHVLSDVLRVVPQHVVLDDDGAFVARGDLWLEGTRRLHEYDGVHHLDVRQQDEDLSRARRLARAGWDRRGYAARTLVDDPAQVIRDAEDALGWSHDPARVADWWYEARRSSVTQDGRRRLYGRLRRFDRASTPRPTPASGATSTAETA